MKAKKITHPKQRGFSVRWKNFLRKTPKIFCLFKECLGAMANEEQVHAHWLMRALLVILHTFRCPFLTHRHLMLPFIFCVSWRDLISLHYERKDRSCVLFNHIPRIGSMLMRPNDRTFIWSFVRSIMPCVEVRYFCSILIVTSFFLNRT